MIPEFGFNRYTSTALIQQDHGMGLDGCAWDLLSTADPYLKVTNYKCNGNTQTLILNVDKSKCTYSTDRIKSDNSIITSNVHKYMCWGVRVNWATQTIEQ